MSTRWHCWACHCCNEASVHPVCVMSCFRRETWRPSGVQRTRGSERFEMLWKWWSRVWTTSWRTNSSLSWVKATTASLSLCSRIYFGLTLHSTALCVLCVYVCLCSSFMAQEFFNYQSNRQLSVLFFILNILFINGNLKGHHTVSVCCVNTVNSLFCLMFETLNSKYSKVVPIYGKY